MREGENVQDEQQDILYRAAEVWKELTEYHYVFTYGYKGELHEIKLTFSLEDFPHLAGFHYLKDEGVMAIILPHGVLFRGGAEERIRTKLLKDGHIDTVIGLPANLFYSTGIPVCILVLKKCKKPDDVLFINAAEHFEKGKRQNQLTDAHIAKIIKTYQFREEEARYSRKVAMAEIEKNDFNLNISRYISTAVGEAEINLDDTHQELVAIEQAIAAAKDKHNGFLKELGLKPLP